MFITFIQEKTKKNKTTPDQTIVYKIEIKIFLQTKAYKTTENNGM